MNPIEIFNLYPHNKETFLKSKESFDNGVDTISSIQATGTGKSYLGLALALEYREKKTIYIVPTLAIIEHLKEQLKQCNLSLEKDFPNLEFKTYSSFVNMTKEEIKNLPCDFLIVDEIHHLGAPVWSERIEYLCKTHPNMKKFGMTAYTVRDRGTSYERDVTNPETNEIFSNSVINTYSLYDAIIDGVLPKPIYKTVITEDDEIVNDIQSKIDILKTKKDPSYKEYEKILLDIKKMIHKQTGIKTLISKSLKPNSKCIYFCPVNTQEGKNDIDTIMKEMLSNLTEQFPQKNIVFYKSTSDDGDIGKYNRECFYNDLDLEGNDAKDSLRIIFVKNQYNEGVHAKGVDTVILGRKTNSDIVAFEQIGRALSIKENTKEEIEKYQKLSQEELISLAKSRGIIIDNDSSKLKIIEQLIAPMIIDLADNIRFIEELETNLKDRVKDIQKKGPGIKRDIKIHDTTINIEVINKDILNILKKLQNTLSRRTWDEMYILAKTYYDHHGHSEIPSRFKTKNGYNYDEEGIKLGIWTSTQRTHQKNLTEEKRKKLELINFRFEKTRNIKDSMPWDEMFELTKKYYEHYGNTEISARFKTKNGTDYNEDGVNLGIWIFRQRNGQEKLSEERKEKLKSINFRFENIRDATSWEEKYELAKKYYDYHGNSEIPFKFKTKNGVNYNEEGIALGKWVNAQRTTKDKLPEEKIRKLELIDFRFENRKNTMSWEEMYELAKKYYEYHGNSEIPTKFKTKNGIDYDEQGIKLGSWISTQRSFHKTLTEERIKKLELIGFRFLTKKEHKEKIIDLCNSYGIDYIKNKFILKIPYPELYAKINFLSEYHRLILSTGELHPILYISNSNMQQQYHISKEELITEYYINKKGRGV